MGFSAYNANRSYPGMPVDLCKYAWDTSNDVKLHGFGEPGDIGHIRAIVEMSTGFVWYMDDDGNIMQNRLDEAQMDNFRQNGVLAVYPDSSDIWDEQRDWDDLVEGDKYDFTGVTSEHDFRYYWDRWSLYILIPAYLRKTGENGPDAGKIHMMYSQYIRGLCTLWEMMDEIGHIIGYSRD